MHARRWIRIAHRVSAVLLAIFLAAHLLNHVVALWGVAAHLAFMDGARLVYRSPALEPMLLAAVLVQIVTGVEQVRAGWGTRRGFWQRTQAVSGLYLAFFLANHTFWVLVARVRLRPRQQFLSRRHVPDDLAAAAPVCAILRPGSLRVVRPPRVCGAFSD